MSIIGNEESGINAERPARQLLSEVMRGALPSWPPPGIGAAFLLLPCSVIASGGVGFLVASGLVAFTPHSREVGPIVALLCLALVSVPQVRIVAGHVGAHRALQKIILVLWGLGLLASVWALRADLSSMVAVTGVALAASTLLSKSKSYAAFSRFRWLLRLAAMMRAGRAREVDEWIDRECPPERELPRHTG